MPELTRFVADLLGIGIAATVSALVCAFVAKSAIARAVDQAARREIEYLKGELAKELERMRMSFQRDLELERQNAARSLEEFKAQLTVASETRRQLAALRLATVIDLMKRAEPLQRTMVNIGPLDPQSHAKAVEAMRDFFRSVEEVAVIFEAAVEVKLKNYASESWKDARLLDTDGKALGRIADRHRDFKDLLRSQIGVETERMEQPPRGS